VWQEVKMGVFSPRTKLHLVTEEQGRKGVMVAARSIALTRG
jgi:hypothetical protein